MPPIYVCNYVAVFFLKVTMRLNQVALWAKFPLKHKVRCRAGVLLRKTTELTTPRCSQRRCARWL